MAPREIIRDFRAVVSQRSITRRAVPAPAAGWCVQRAGPSGRFLRYGLPLQREMIADRLDDHVIDARPLAHGQHLQRGQQLRSEPKRCHHAGIRRLGGLLDRRGRCELGFRLPRQRAL